MVITLTVPDDVVLHGICIYDASPYSGKRFLAHCKAVGDESGYLQGGFGNTMQEALDRAAEKVRTGYQAAQAYQAAARSIQSLTTDDLDF